MRVLFTAFVSTLLVSCSAFQKNTSTGPGPSLGGYLRGGGYVGASSVDDGVDELDGVAAGGRVEVGGVLGERRMFELGARLSLGAADLDGDIVGSNVELSGRDLSIEPIARVVIPTEGALRPYAEIFVGYRDFEADFTATSGLGSGTVDWSSDGVSYGFGAGIQVDTSEQALLVAGLEWRTSDMDVSVPGLPGTGEVDMDDLVFVFLVGTAF